MIKFPFPEMYKVVCSMLSRNECLAFREPVDWKKLDLVDYPEIIRKPMDLGTVKSKIESEKYSTIEDIAADIRLVFTNCMLYNKDGSEFYQLADKFARAFEEVYKTLKPDAEAEDLDRVPTVDEKMQLSYEIFRISNHELARVLTMIEEKCPSALLRNHSADEVFIAFDALSCRCFHEVNKYVKDSLNSKKRGTKKKRVSESNAGGDSSEKKKSNKSKSRKSTSNTSVDDDDENDDEDDIANADDD